jgi:hypothetical protein
MSYLKHNEPAVYERWKRKYGTKIVASAVRAKRKKRGK